MRVLSFGAAPLTLTRQGIFKTSAPFKTTQHFNFGNMKTRFRKHKTLPRGTHPTTMQAGREWRRVGVLLALVTIAVAQSPKYKKADTVPLYANKVRRLPCRLWFFGARYTGSATRSCLRAFGGRSSARALAARVRALGMRGPVFALCARASSTCTGRPDQAQLVEL